MSMILKYNGKVHRSKGHKWQLHAPTRTIQFCRTVIGVLYTNNLKQ